MICHSSPETAKIYSEMRLQINGEARDFTPPLSLTSLIEQLGMKHDRVAIELNRNIVPRELWAETPLGEGDRLEIVHFVGGGLSLTPDCQELL
jgi:sulfur carrier protein